MVELVERVQAWDVWYAGRHLGHVTDMGKQFGFSAYVRKSAAIPAAPVGAHLPDMYRAADAILDYHKIDKKEAEWPQAGS